MENNIKKYYAFSLFVRFTFYSPVFVLLLTNKGLSIQDILLFQAIHSLGALLADVPCGAFADKYSRKISLIIGSALWGTTLILYGISNTTLEFYLLAFIGGVGQAFMSGSDTVLLHETLQSLNKDKEFPKIVGRSVSIYTFFRIISTIASGFLAAISIPLTLFLSGTNVLISTIIASTFKKPLVDIDLKKISIFRTIIKGLKIVLKNKEILFLTLTLSILNGLIWTSTSLTQPYLKTINIPIEYYGIIFGFFGILTALTSHNIYKFKKFNENSFLILVLLVCSISMIIMGIFANIVVFLLWGFLEILTVVVPFIISGRTIKLVDKNMATTILSFQSLSQRLSNIILTTIVGYIVANVGIFDSFKYISILFFIGFLILLYLHVKYLRNPNKLLYN